MTSLLRDHCQDAYSNFQLLPPSRSEGLGKSFPISGVDVPLEVPLELQALLSPARQIKMREPRSKRQERANSTSNRRSRTNNFSFSSQMQQASSLSQSLHCEGHKNSGFDERTLLSRRLWVEETIEQIYTISTYTHLYILYQALRISHLLPRSSTEAYLTWSSCSATSLPILESNAHSGYSP